MVRKRKKIEKNIEAIANALHSIYEPAYDISEFYNMLSGIDALDNISQKHKELDEVRRAV